MCKHTDNPIDNRSAIRAEYVKRFPGIARTNPQMIDSFVDYRMACNANGGRNVTEAPIIPARISARHPLAH